MANTRFAVSFLTLLAFGGRCSGAPAAGGDDASSNFKLFSSNLLKESDLDEFSIEKGAAISSPFGVGYMLANINDQVWNVSNVGIDNVLKSPKDKITAQYASLVEKLNKAKMLTHSVVYVRDKNSTVTLPEGSKNLKTEMTFADFITEWRSSWFSMNDMITNQTGGKLNDQLVPKGGWWGSSFYPFTMSAYINTNHMKLNFEKNLLPIGKKSFWDGLSVNFYEAEGKFPLSERDNYSAVALPLSEKGKYVVFVLPKGKLANFIRMDLTDLLENVDPTAWLTKDKKVQVPALNITLLDQHYKKLETLGINHTFCMPEVEGESSSAGRNLRGPFFASPIVQAHHIQLSSGFLEVASATGSSVNSEEKLKEDHAPDYDYGAASPADNGPLDAPDLTELTTLAGGGDDENAEVVVPVVLDDKIAKSLEEGKMEIKGVDLTIEDPKTHEKITAQGSLLDEPPSSDDIAAAAADAIQSDQASDSTLSTSSAESSTVSAPTTTTIKIEARADLPLSTVAPESVDQDTLQFSKPFFWYLYDKDLGPLYYGAVHSLATYKKEYGLETDEDFWLFDAYKTLLWNCP